MHRFHLLFYLELLSAEPSLYETKPFFAGGLPEDVLDLYLSLLAPFGAGEPLEEPETDTLLLRLRLNDNRFSARGDARYLDGGLLEGLRTGLLVIRRRR